MAGIPHLQTLEWFVRWTARVWGTLVLAFVLIFLLADILAPGASAGFANADDGLGFALFPLGTIVGLAIAWKWPGWGGLVATAAMTGLLILRSDLIGSPIFTAVIAPPGLIHLASWFVSARSSVEPVALSKKAKWIGAVTITALVLAVVMVISLPRQDPYSLASELDQSFTGKVEQVQVAIDVGQPLGPVFTHSFEHSLTAALESNGVEATIVALNLESIVASDDSSDAQANASDATMRITIDPLLRTREDGYEAIVGTMFDVSVRDTARENDLWHAAGKVDYIAMFGPRYRASENIKREFAFSTTAAIVSHFVAEVNGDEPTPIYTSLEGRRRHGQRVD